MARSVLKGLALGALAAAIMALWSVTARAQQAGLWCGNHTAISRALEDKFGDVRVGVGLIGNSAMVEMYAADRGSWTFLMTRPDGTSCIIASGDSWETMPPPIGSGDR